MLLSDKKYTLPYNFFFQYRNFFTYFFVSTPQNMEKVLELLCVLLAQVVNSGGGTDGLRQRLSQLAEHVSKRLRSSESLALPAALVEAYTKLCKLMTFFDQFHSENHEGALEVRNMYRCKSSPIDTQNALKNESI